MPIYIQSHHQQALGIYRSQWRCFVFGVHFSKKKPFFSLISITDFSPNHVIFFAFSGSQINLYSSCECAIWCRVSFVVGFFSQRIFMETSDQLRIIWGNLPRLTCTILYCIVCTKHTHTSRFHIETWALKCNSLSFIGDDGVAYMLQKHDVCALRRFVYRFSFINFMSLMLFASLYVCLFARLLAAAVVAAHFFSLLFAV